MKRCLSWSLFLLVLLHTEILTAADVDPRKPASIVVENVPVIPPDLAETLQQYQAIRHARFRSWAPDGQGMLVQTQFANTPQLHRVLQPLASRTQLTFDTEPVDGRFIPGRTDGILTVKSAGGNENDQLYWYDFSRSAPTRLTDGTSRNLLGPVSPDGRWVAISSNRRNGRDMDLLLGDLQQMGSWSELLPVTNETWQPLAFAPDNSRLLVMRIVSINERYPALLDVKTRQVTPIPFPTGVSSPVAIGSGAFAADGQSLYLTLDAESEFLRLARISLQDFSYQWLTADIPHDIDHFEVDPRQNRIALTANVNGANRLYLITDNGPPRQIDVPLGIIDSLEFSPHQDLLGLTLSRPDAPADAYALEIGQGMLTRWTASETGGLRSDAFIRPEQITFPSFDGRQIPAYAFKPASASSTQPAPVLILIHGGPESQYRPYFNGSDQFYLNELGLAVICPNVRGSAGYGKTYLQLDNGLRREDSVKDIGALLDWIQQQPDLDSQRVAVMGGSYGGYMVLASLVMHGERLRAGIDIVGIANFVTFLENTSDYRKDLRRVEYGNERDPEMRAFFDRISPARNASRIKSALLVAHGRNDPRVPFSEASQIAPLVRQNGQEVWTLYADNEGHGFRKKDNRDYYTAAVALFLQKHLQSPPPQTSHHDHHDLQYYLDPQGQRQPIRTPADWAIRRQQVVSHFEQVAGPLPGAAARVPLDVKILSEVREGQVTRRKISYQSDADDRVTAWLLIPDHPADSRLPAVLCLHQTTSLGKDEPAGLGGLPTMHYAAELTARGYVTLSPDYPSFGEHPYDFAPEHGYASGTMKGIWDNIRAVDLLNYLAFVDDERIGCVGHSLGGHNAIFTGIFEPRLKAIVSSCGFCTFQKDDVPSWTGPRYFPRIASRFNNSADQVPFDFPELIGSLAPRAFLASAAVGDDDFNAEGVQEVMAAARSVYQLLGQPDRLQAIYPEGPHDFPQSAREAAYRFLDVQLRPTADLDSK